MGEDQANSAQFQIGVYLFCPMAARALRAQMI
jgi:hypothetical protein